MSAPKCRMCHGVGYLPWVFYVGSSTIPNAYACHCEASPFEKARKKRESRPEPLAAPGASDKGEGT